MKVVAKENLLAIRLVIHRSGNMDRASRRFHAATVPLLDLYNSQLFEESGTPADRQLRSAQQRDRVAD